MNTLFIGFKIHNKSLNIIESKNEIEAPTYLSARLGIWSLFQCKLQIISLYHQLIFCLYFFISVEDKVWDPTIIPLFPSLQAMTQQRFCMTMCSLLQSLPVPCIP